MALQGGSWRSSSGANCKQMLDPCMCTSCAAKRVLLQWVCMLWAFVDRGGHQSSVGHGCDLLPKTSPLAETLSAY